MWSSFSYHEPTSTQIITLAGFLLSLNVGAKLASKWLSAGLLGQIFVGIIFGSPLAGILEPGWEETIVIIGYIGLLLVVFEGGMSSSISNLRSILPLSIAIATTGLVVPIALSFILIPLNGSSALHAFASGSALSSTSLGTVLSVLHPSTIGFDLRKTSFGTALLSAAVMDDIVAFILVKVLSILGSGDTSTLGADIGRTMGVTIGLGVFMLFASIYVLRPGYKRLKEWDRSKRPSRGGEKLLICLMTVIFLGVVVAAGYGGTSPLYGAYIAGLSIAYLSELDHEDVKDDSACDDPEGTDVESALRLSRRNTFPSSNQPRDGPRPGSVDRGLTDPTQLRPTPRKGLIETFDHYITPLMTYLLVPLFFGSIGYSIPFVPLWKGRIIWRGIIYTLLMVFGKVFCGTWMLIRGFKGWRAVLVLGLAMISRGEIGLLISQVARSTENPLLDQDEFLITTWAIVLCTIVGPVSVGWAVKRWKKRILVGGWE